MPVKHYECQSCYHVFRVLKKAPEVCPECDAAELKRLIKAPKVKFMEKVDDFKNKSRLKDSNKILKERARNHSRDNEIMDLAQTNTEEQARKNEWLVENSDGSLRKRKKIDDI